MKFTISTMSDPPTIARYASRNMNNSDQDPEETKTDDTDGVKHEETAIEQPNDSATMSRSQAIMLAGTVMLTYWMMVSISSRQF